MQRHRYDHDCRCPDCTDKEHFLTLAVRKDDEIDRRYAREGTEKDNISKE